MASIPLVKERKTQKAFSGEIRVASQIVDLLSSGLYESPAACLKELVNNSYDADAGQVRIFVRPDADRIIIEDNGVGMSRQEFEEHFTLISESHKRDVSDTTSRGRKKIGKIGIGFVAANEICDLMEIMSTKKGSTDLLHVNIDFAKMRLSVAERKRPGEAIAKGDYEGKILHAKREEHYTHVFLKNVRGQAKTILASAGRYPSGRPAIGLYGRQPESVAKILRSEDLKTWKQLDAYSQSLLGVALNVPISYAPNWMPGRAHAVVRSFEDQVAKFGFHVSYDGAELRKPTVFRPGRAIAESFSHSGDEVSAEAYLYAQHGVLRPEELNGILIRIRHAALGGYDQSFMSFPTSEGTLFQRWISGEVWADDRLEDAMNIDRKTLRVAHPAYVELQKVVHDWLSGFIKRVRDELYQEQSEKRKDIRSGRELETLIALIDENSSLLGPSLRRELAKHWRTMASDASSRGNLTRSYRFGDLLRILLEVGPDLVSPKDLRSLIRELNRRFTK